MNYQKIQPCSALAPFVDSIWVQKNDMPASGSPTVILPTTTIDLVFHFGDPFVEVNENGCNPPLPRMNIAGQNTKPANVLATGRTGIIIASLKPWGFYHLFGIPADEVKNSSVDLKDLVKVNAIDYLEEKILEAKSIQSRVEVVESFLRTLQSVKCPDNMIIEAAHYINNTKGTLSISKIRDQSFISKRQFIRRFQKVIGLNPKQFSDIIRFQKALLYIKMEMPTEKLLETLRYYDQAHMIKEFNKYGGFTPQSNFQKNLSTPLKKYFNSDSDMSLFYNTIYL